jgi:hypothetical protein
MRLYKRMLCTQKIPNPLNLIRFLSLIEKKNLEVANPFEFIEIAMENPLLHSIHDD